MNTSEQAYRRLQRRVDRLCCLILSDECPEREINIERLSMRTEAAHLFPEKLFLYDMIYESRYRRLWQQFRTAPSPF